MKHKALFLGTGGSAGIPMLGCSCSVCNSSDPRDVRLRPSLLLSIRDKTLLIDTGPDLRYQCLKYGVTHLDGVIITHVHFDHIAGLDELRSFYLINRQILPVLVSANTLDQIKKKYDYMFEKRDEKKSLSAQLDFRLLENKRGKTTFLGLPLQYMTYEQGGMEVNGFRFGSLAYLSDIKYYDESIFEDLQGLDILIMSALRREPSPVHFNIEEAVRFAAKVGAKRTLFMHMAHEVMHDEVSLSLPAGCELAYDGLTVEFEL
jgi:phosphoribosyl 1,2-cyclic phosphate phosphodiesterase